MSLLDDAKATLRSRDGTYGADIVENFRKIASIANEFGVAISPEQVAKVLIALKLFRLQQSPDHYDSWVDLVAYTDIFHQIRVDALEAPDYKPEGYGPPVGDDPSVFECDNPFCRCNVGKPA